MADDLQDIDPREQLLDAAEELFYARGIQTVGMDEVRELAGLSLKRMYQLYPGKDDLVLAMLDRRNERWLGDLADFVDATPGPDEALLAVFDWLRRWFNEPGFRGCAWANAFGELGGVSPDVARAAAEHQEGLRVVLGALVDAAGYRASVADHLMLLAEGAIVTAAVSGSPNPATQAKAAAKILLESAPRRGGAKVRAGRKAR